MKNMREATSEDVPFIMKMIRELAEYEKAPEKVFIDESDLLRDGFGDNPLFHSIILEWKGHPVGMALYCYRYSTWRGRTLYLDDLYITPDFRGKGLGKMALLHLAGIAEKTGSGRMEWTVLEWNRPSIDFYKSLGAEVDPEWHICRVHGEDIGRMAAMAED